MGTPKKDRVRHFDFKKKPMRPWLLWLAKAIISFPDLKRRKAVIRKHGMEELEGQTLVLHHAGEGQGGVVLNMAMEKGFFQGGDKLGLVHEIFFLSLKI